MECDVLRTSYDRHGFKVFNLLVLEIDRIIYSPERGSKFALNYATFTGAGNSQVRGKRLYRLGNTHIGSMSALGGGADVSAARYLVVSFY